MIQNRNIARFETLSIVVMMVSSWWVVQGGHPAVVSASSGSTDDQGRELTVRIHHRQFIPHIFHLRVGQSIRLILKNEDAELHAFVPVDLLVRTNVQVGGNGAPQFNKEGFHRVLIPSGGQADLVFVPKKAGSYPFFCDLPGHVMNGTVVVEGKKDMVQ